MMRTTTGHGRVGRWLALVALALGAGVQAQVAPECVPAVRSLQAGELAEGARGLESCADAGFGVERAQARLMLAEVHARGGQFDAALAVLDEVARMEPVLHELEPAELAAGEVSIAAPGYLRRGARSPALVLGQANYMRTVYLLESGRPLQAARHVQAMLDAGYSMVQEESLRRIRQEEMMLVQMAAALQQAGDAPMCARFMREIPLEAAPKLPLRSAQISTFAVLYSTCHAHADAVEDGIAHYEALIQARPSAGRSASLASLAADHPNLFTAMLVAEARLRMVRNDFGERTRFLLDQAIARGPGVPEPRYMRAYLHLRAGDAEKAQRDLAQAEQLLPGDPSHDQFVSLFDAVRDRR
jgi:tetratricopeptide (TPR) repeat protein